MRMNALDIRTKFTLFEETGGKEEEGREKYNRKK